MVFNRIPREAGWIPEDSGDRIKPAFMKGMATRNTLDTEPGTLEDTVQFYRLNRVLGARRIVAAVAAEKGADQELVTSYQHDEQPSCHACQGIHKE